MRPQIRKLRWNVCGSISTDEIQRRLRIECCETIERCSTELFLWKLKCSFVFLKMPAGCWCTRWICTCGHDRQSKTFSRGEGWLALVGWSKTQNEQFSFALEICTNHTHDWKSVDIRSSWNGDRLRFPPEYVGKACITQQTTTTKKIPLAKFRTKTVGI